MTMTTSTARQLSPFDGINYHMSRVCPNEVFIHTSHYEASVSRTVYNWIYMYWEIGCFFADPNTLSDKTVNIKSANCREIAKLNPQTPPSASPLSPSPSLSLSDSQNS